MNMLGAFFWFAPLPAPFVQLTSIQKDRSHKYSAGQGVYYEP